MYHQFKELGDVDITKESMEVGPTAHYTMGGIRVDPETQQSRIKGLFAAGECAAGMHGSNRLGGNSLSDLLVFGRIAGLHAAKYAKTTRAASELDDGEIEDAAREALAPFDRDRGAEPVRSCTKTSRTRCRRYVGIIRTEEDLKKGSKHLERLDEATARVKVDGQPPLQRRRGTRRSTCATCSSSARRWRARRWRARRAAAGTRAKTSPTWTRSTSPR